MLSMFQINSTSENQKVKYFLIRKFNICYYLQDKLTTIIN